MSMGCDEVLLALTLAALEGVRRVGVVPSALDAGFGLLLVLLAFATVKLAPALGNNGGG